MPRNMSFALTTEQAEKRQKTVTRRQGWYFLKPGDLFWQVRKAMGLKKGEQVERIHLCRVVSTRVEPVEAITQKDVALEGFPGRSRQWFINMYCSHHGIDPADSTNRIEFEYVEAPWVDYAGQKIYPGDTIRHPLSGEEGVVVFDSANGADETDRWLVEYHDNKLHYRLCLQIGEKGQASVILRGHGGTP